MDKPMDPIRPTDNDARALARDLIASARFGALGVLDPETGLPHVTRIAVGTDADGQPLTLISSLSAHTRALHANPACSLLLGEPGSKGDPLTHPRVTLACKAVFTGHDDPAYGGLAERWLKDHPKARLYIGFGDFSFASLHVHHAALNGGFGKAYTLTSADLGL